MRGMNRRGFLLATLGLGSAAAAWQFWPDEGLWNPCEPAPERASRQEIVREAWVGLDPANVWDMHVHLFGPGGEGSRVWVNPAMRSVFHPFELIHTQFYANAACMADGTDGADAAYITRLRALQSALAPGIRLLLLAMDYFHDESGTRVPSRTVFHVPNEYASAVAEQHAGYFEWAASIHPYRADCVGALDWAVAHGARAVKWIPSAMGIDPAAPACDRFYEALARRDVPLLTHGGYEHPLIGSGALQECNNPLALRRALEHGVRVVVAHCASTGASIDTDRGGNGPEMENFALFTRLMDDPRHDGKLFGDISALTESSRVGPLLRYVMRRGDWHNRLLNGSDYPLPGYMPGVSVKHLIAEKFITGAQGQELRTIRRYNPLLFDFVLKRHLTAGDIRFASSVFETAGFFHRHRTGSAGV
ncbi:MAG: amidohydrolase [Casimicrobiaceae bacterium]